MQLGSGVKLCLNLSYDLCYMYEIVSVSFHTLDMDLRNLATTSQRNTICVCANDFEVLSRVLFTYIHPALGENSPE